MEEKKILIICGEASGDLNAANLAAALKRLDPGIKISAVGGTHLAQTGAEILYDIKGLAAIGLFDVLKKLPRFFALKKLILEKLENERFSAIILVDFSGFNLRIAKAINKMLPVIYYISPQVWASRSGRVKTIQKYISKIVVIFKFEEEFYRRYGIDATFVGHPLLDIVKPTMKKEELLVSLKFSAAKITLALLPGSRKEEVSNILPLMLKASRIIRRNIDAQFLIAKSPQVDWDIYNRLLKGYENLEVKTVEGRTYDCLELADFALVASGTATLETAIMQKPFVVIYKMNPLNYLLYRPQVKVPYIGMVNIVAGKKIIAEFIQFGASANRIAKEAIKTLKDPQRIKEIKNNLAAVKALLGEKDASLRAAQAVLTFLKDS